MSDPVILAFFAFIYILSGFIFLGMAFGISSIFDNSGNGGMNGGILSNSGNSREALVPVRQRRKYK